MLSVYARHYPPCDQKNPAYRRCRCPKWIQGTTESGEFIRRSSKTRSWDKAQKLVNKLENPEEKPPVNLPEPTQSEPDSKRTTIEVAVETFLNDANSRGLQEPTQQKLKHLCRRQLVEWAKTESLVYLDELTTANLTNFRNGWSDAALSKKKKHERLIGFFSFCVGCGWIQKNPASVMGRVKSNPVPTDYFPREEFEKIVDSTYVYQEKGYLRKILIHGARAAVLRIKRDRAPIGAWLDALDSRAPKNVVVVAMANKLARIAWAVLSSGNDYRPVAA